jgi:HSP20 family protein
MKGENQNFAPQHVKPKHLAKIMNMNALEKWNPFRASAQWDPIRELEEMQNRLGSLFGRRLPLLRASGEEGFTVTEWSPPVDIAEAAFPDRLQPRRPGTSVDRLRQAGEP